MCTIEVYIYINIENIWGIAPKIEASKRRVGVGYGDGCSLLRLLVGLGERLSWSTPSGSGEEPCPKTHFGVFWRPQIATFCIYMLMLWVRQTVFHVTFGEGRGKDEVYLTTCCLIQLTYLNLDSINSGNIKILYILQPEYEPGSWSWSINY